MAQPGTTKGDMSSGHGAWAPRPSNEASEDVFFGGRAAVRVNDEWTIHCVGPSCHEGAVRQGSETVIINGEGAVRIGDQIDCGCVVVQGDFNVIVGD